MKAVGTFGRRCRFFGSQRLLPPCRLAVFDKDGTLLDMDATFAPTLTMMATRLAPVFPGGIHKVHEFLGCDEQGRTRRGSEFMVATHEQSRDRIARDVGKEAADVFQEFLHEMQQPKAVPMVPLAELFGELKQAGIQVAVLTTDDRRFTDECFETEGVSGLIDTIICGDDGLPVKPAAESILEICRRLQVDPAETAMIGDSASRDIGVAMAANVGLAIGVTSGVSSAETLLDAGAHLVLPSVKGVPEVLRRRQHGRVGIPSERRGKDI